MALFQTVCMECWECEQGCKQFIDNIKDSGNNGFKKEKCKENQVRDIKTVKQEIVMNKKEIPPFWIWNGKRCQKCGRCTMREDVETGAQECCNCGYKP